MRVDVGIIGGTGVGERLEGLPGRVVRAPTRFGLFRCRVVEWGGLRVAAVSRHSPGHRVAPHRVNYRAISQGLASLGARSCLATAAVGSLRPDWRPGTLAVCSDFLDATGRNLTLVEDRVVHTDFSQPFTESARQALIQGAASARVDVEDRCVYVCANGPRYETPFEVDLYRRAGGDVVGMTAASEAIALRESGVAYACLAVVTNSACGIEPTPLSHEDVVSVMRSSADRVLAILQASVAILGGQG